MLTTKQIDRFVARTTGVGLLCATVACGGGSGSPAAPSSPTGPSTSSLSGQVTDSVTSNAIPGAVVSIADGPNAGRSATTDASGNYNLTGLQRSGFTVNVTAAGYTPTSRGVTLTSDQTVSFRLTRNLDGSWEASAPSASIRNVSFRVANGVLVELVIQYRVEILGPFGVSCTATMTQTNMSVPITANSFTAPFAVSGFSTTVSATFSSASGGTGSVGTVRFDNWRCGSLTTNGFTVGASFTFSKAGS